MGFIRFTSDPVPVHINGKRRMVLALTDDSRARTWARWEQTSHRASGEHTHQLSFIRCRTPERSPAPTVRSPSWADHEAAQAPRRMAERSHRVSPKRGRSRVNERCKPNDTNYTPRFEHRRYVRHEKSRGTP